MSETGQLSSEAGKLALMSLLTRETVGTKIAVQNWEDAVDQAGSVLLKAGKIEPGYIQAMKRVLQELGPYAVIAPGIVLLHARPEDGVRQPCLALLTLSTPVEFGHSENDPVDLVFALGAVDKKSHILALQQLAQLLGNGSILEKIRTAQDVDSLLNVFMEN